MDDESWAIRHLVVETGHLFSHRKIAISPQHVDHISYEEHAVFVNMTKEAILEYHVPLGAMSQNARCNSTKQTALQKSKAKSLDNVSQTDMRGGGSYTT